MNDALHEQKVLAANVRGMMFLRGWKQMDLAKEAKVSQRAICDVLNCTKATRIDVIAKIARAFKLQTYQLLVPNLINPDAFPPPKRAA